MPGEIAGRTIPVDHDFPPLVRGQDRQIGDGRVRLLGQRCEQRGEMIEQSRDGRFVKTIA